MWTSNKIRLTIILLFVVSTIVEGFPGQGMPNFQFLQLDPSTPIPGQPVTAKWKENSNSQSLSGIQFEILQGSATVASPVDFSPTQVDQENQEFVFTAPASAGIFDLAVFGNGVLKPLTLSTTLVVSAALTSSEPAPSHASAGQAATTAPESSVLSTKSSTSAPSSLPSSLGTKDANSTSSGRGDGSGISSSQEATTAQSSAPDTSIATPTSNNVNAGESQTVPTSDSSAQPGNTASSGSSQHSKVRAIVGGVIGGVFFLLLLTAVLCFWRRRARKRLSSSASTSTFQRDLMVRSKSDSPSAQGLQMRDSQVFQFGAFEKVSPSRRASSSSIDDADEKTPSLANFTSSPTRRQSTRPTSPTATSIYTDYTQSTEVQYDSAVPRIPARTDRQMEIQEQIMDLRGQMIGMVDSGNAGELSTIRERIKKLEEAQSSEWALEMSDVPPSGLEGVLQSEGMAK
ncbi:hypothetical protein VKT23_018667 [Stygiomarasmius scandens]|uniref:Uncharacterized protein n=1 Tax=Marasmiellus scandens TaxID=2682957 RepID=A0ABR1INE8_9AGAR